MMTAYHLGTNNNETENNYGLELRRYKRRNWGSGTGE